MWPPERPKFSSFCLLTTFSRAAQLFPPPQAHKSFFRKQQIPKLRSSTQTPHKILSASLFTVVKMLRPACSPSSRSLMEPSRLHMSSVRFLLAGLYTDAIHSIIEGLNILDFTLVNDEQDEESPFDLPTWSKTLYEDSAVVVDTKPFDHSWFAGPESTIDVARYPRCQNCEASLICAMVYNLALSYHLYAVNNHDDINGVDFLTQAAILYQEAAKRFRVHDDSISHVPPALKANLLHVYRRLLSIQYQQEKIRLPIRKSWTDSTDRDMREVSQALSFIRS